MGRRRTTGSGRGVDRPELVGDLLERTRQTTSRAAGRAVDGELWRRAVGPRIAERATPGRLERGVLSVHVASSVWAQELSLLERELCERLHAAGLGVSSLRFRVSARPSTARPAPKRAPTPPPPLPPELAERLKHVDDPELRATIADAAGHWLAERERARVTSQKPAARGLRSGAPGSDRQDRAGPPPRGASPRTSGGGRGRGR